MSDGIPKPNTFARKLAGKAAKRLLSKALESAAAVVRAATDRAAEATHEAVERTAENRLPIQRSIDIAVPIRVAWDEWQAFEFIPEGVDTVTDVERDGNTLVGQTKGVRAHEWAAEIIDERDGESFAWQSNVGSDCAGLVTFHELSDRLTRIELNLDVVPAGIGETLQLATHRADRRAELDLRRFKARLELINPDLYAQEPEPEPEDEPEEPADVDEPEAEADDDLDDVDNVDEPDDEELDDEELDDEELDDEELDDEELDDEELDDEEPAEEPEEELARQ